MGCGASTAAPDGTADAPARAQADGSKPLPPVTAPEAKAPTAAPSPAEPTSAAPSAAAVAEAAPPPPVAPALPPPPEYVAPEHERSSEIFEAIDSGSVEALKALLDEGEVPAGVLDEDRNTPLHKAAEGETDCAKALIEKLDQSSGVYEAKNAEGETALMVAIKYEDASLCTILLEAGARATEEAIAKAREGGVPEVVTAVTGELVKERNVRERKGSEDFRRVSVSGQDIKEFTSAFSSEKEVRRQSVGGTVTSINDAAAIAALVPELPDDDDDEPDPDEPEPEPTPA